jgi:hypothetical protein
MKISVSKPNTVLLAAALRKARVVEARAIANDIFRGVKDTTPVDTGTAKRGWRLLTKSKNYEIVNNVPYIGVLDQGRSFRDGQMRGSTQAPKGMTGPTLRQLRTRKRAR